MDKGLSYKEIPKAPEPANAGTKGGVIQGFPTTGKATENEFCENCGCKVGGYHPAPHCGNPCGGKKK